MANSEQRRVADRFWELIEAMIPPRPMPRGPGGRSCIDAGAALEGVLFGLDTGNRRREPPERGLGIRAYRLGPAGRVAGRRCLGRSLALRAAARVDAIVLRGSKVLGVAQDGAWTVVENLRGSTAECTTILGPFREASRTRQKMWYTKQLNSRNGDARTVGK